MDGQRKSAVEAELSELIQLGQKVRVKFYLECCDTKIPEEYVLEIPEDEWDEVDKLAHQEYLKKVEMQEKAREAVSDIGQTMSAYERFYTLSIRVINEFLPERLSDFQSQYQLQKNRKEITYDNYSIYDGLRGVVIKYENLRPDIALTKIDFQVSILESIKDNLNSKLFEIEELLRAELFDDELKSAEHLLKHGHLRAAGAVAGVVLEKHLIVVAKRHGFTSRKKASTIADFNEYLKAEGKIDVPTWRRIQGLADIRNLCDHPKERDPNFDDVEDLIRGSERILKQVF